MIKYFRFVLVLMIIVLAACGKTDIPVLSVGEIVSQSVTRMQAMDGFSFLIVRSGEHAYLDAEQGISFSRAEGSFNSPDQVSAKVKAVVVTLGILAEVETISIGDAQWQTNMLTGMWEEIESGSGFNPSVLFHPETGIQSLLANDLSNLVLIGQEELEEIPGKQLYLLRATLNGAMAYALSFGLIGPEELDVRIWISPDTFELYRLEVVEPGVDDGEGTVWLIDFWDYDQVADINSPLP